MKAAPTAMFAVPGALVLSVTAEPTVTVMTEVALAASRTVTVATPGVAPVTVNPLPPALSKTEATPVLLLPTV